MNIQEEGHAPSDLLKVRKIKQVIRIKCSAGSTGTE
jgi:hypothetical protein